ncbi:MAG: type II secretion system protein [Patescibacteria group bacterium]
MKRLFKKQERGFTLVELLVVVAIIGLLVGMLVISIKGIKAKARDTQRVADINSYATALGLYHNDYNTYPIYDGYITRTDSLSTALINAEIMNNPPLDPLNQDSVGCGSLSGYHYYYRSTDGRDYYLGYCLETDSIHGKSKGENYFIP